MPTNGMRKIASSHAIAAVGLRCRGMKMSASDLDREIGEERERPDQVREVPASTARPPVDRGEARFARR